ncbi:TauD/TfdA family dioxygenase [Streptomyces yunnanensis]|uniref:TauD/TfdA family dioxygenase n=1 Tax=Streptomyces yunnanensis TaxID=156453 RepID=A0ABY8A5T4_9ACTN|nr:TauD/TfdA family dioxygenase [Streptomyces yunnanensis]WEB39569.1 TauD/TfdA family dioxygenase [Streptomyces yunnanensis]
MPDTTLSGVTVQPLSGHIGAEIYGVDLAKPLDDSVIETIRSAVLRWKVVFFREQDIDHAAHVAFGQRFGELIRMPARGSVSPKDYPEIETTADFLEHGPTFGLDNNEWTERNRHSPWRGWHIDASPRIDPPTATILRAEQVPSYGGDTMWANLAAAYTGLSEAVQRLADGLRVEHRLGVTYRPRPGRDAYVEHLMENQAATIHPLVRVHPETGERVLFIDCQYIEQIIGVSRFESQGLLSMFTEQILRPEYTVRFRWEPGSVAFWDNRSTMHLGPVDTAHLESGIPRIMHRVMVVGDIPVGVDGKPSESLVGAPLNPKLS